MEVKKQRLCMIAVRHFSVTFKDELKKDNALSSLFLNSLPQAAAPPPMDTIPLLPDELNKHAQEDDWETDKNFPHLHLQ